MEVVKNEQTGTWHLVGARGCGADPGGESLDATWATIRGRVARDDGDRCANCNWPTG